MFYKIISKEIEIDTREDPLVLFNKLWKIHK